MTRFLVPVALACLSGACAPSPRPRERGEVRDASYARPSSSAARADAPAARNENRPDPQRVVRGVIDQTNDFRRREGRSAVDREKHLTKVAQAFADYMARTGRFGHEADGRQPAERATAGGYAYCLVSENIASAQSSDGFETSELAGRLVTGWRESPGHRKNMLDPDVLETGVAVAQAKDGTWYAVQLFGRPESARLDFQLVNPGTRPVSYTVGGERFTLEPRWSRTHAQCRPDEVVFGRGDKLRPADGAAYELTADASGTVRVRRTPQRK